jgi:transposase
MAAERERADIRRERDEWSRCRQPAMRKSPARLVFVDETSVKTNMTPLRGRSRRGLRLHAEAPFGKWATQTFIAGLRCDAITAPFVVDGAMDGDKFDTYVRTQLAPTLRPGDVVIWDNLNVHKSPRAAAAIAEKKAWILFLPRYSPDLNPIELAFSKLKTLPRKKKARTYDDLWKAVGKVCELFTPQECWNYFKQAGCVHINRPTL